MRRASPDSKDSSAAVLPRIFHALWVGLGRVNKQKMATGWGGGKGMEQEREWTSLVTHMVGCSLQRSQALGSVVGEGYEGTGPGNVAQALPLANVQARKQM